MMYHHMCNSPIRGLCFLPVSVSVGISPHQLNKTRIPVYMAHMPAGTSTKNLLHFVQNRQQKDFRRYDYGEQENLWRYGTPFPPRYPLYKISAPIALFWGKSDRLATPEDVSTLRRELRHTIIYDYLVPDPEFAHLDFTIGINAKEVLHDPVLHVINDFNKGLHLGLYRPEFHDTLFAPPVPPFPLPPMTHKNPSGLPIMGVKFASIPMKPWHQDHEPEFSAVAQKPDPLFEMSGPPSMDSAHFHFPHFEETMHSNLPKPVSFGNHRGFGSSLPRPVFSQPHHVPQVPKVPAHFGLAEHGVQNHVGDLPVSYLPELRPPPVRNLPKSTAPPEISHDTEDELQSHLPESNESAENVQENEKHSVEVSKPLPAEDHLDDFGLDSDKPIAMHPDNNGGFQTDWFPVIGGSKKLNLHDLMPSASKKQPSNHVQPTSKPRHEKTTTSQRIRGPYQTPWRVI